MSTFHWHCSDRNSNLCLNRSIWTLFHIKCAVLISLDLIFYGKHRFHFWGPRGHEDTRGTLTLGYFLKARQGTKLSRLFESWMTWPLVYVLLFSNPYCRIIHLAPCVGLCLILAQYHPLELSVMMEYSILHVHCGSH